MKSAKDSHPMKTDPPASLISDGYTIDLIPWWRHYLNMLNPFRRRRSKAVPMEDAMILNKSSFERGFGHGSVYKTVSRGHMLSRERTCV